MGKFSLQRLLELKRRKEETIAAELAAARMAEKQAREAVDEMRGVREAAVRGTASNGLRAGQIQNAALVIAHIDRQLDDAAKTAREAERKVHRRMADFTEALQERRVLDRLKEKHLEEEAAQEIRIDQEVMDAIALTRFGRRTNQETKGGS